MKKYIYECLLAKAAIVCLLLIYVIKIQGQDRPYFNKSHGLYTNPFELKIIPITEEGVIFYTLDGSEPNRLSNKYTASISVDKTTIIRAVEEKSDGSLSKISTSSYLFYDDILDMDSVPEGYPDKWGPYIEIPGMAKADYAMDTVMTKDPILRSKMKEGLEQIPIVSIVTDKGNLFNNSEDPETGGIYIHTGAPVGDGLGRGWERPVSFELINGGGTLDVTVDCAIKIHGGHSRLSEKNPKHAFRLKFKSAYGPSKLISRIFGENAPEEYNTLTLRTFFNNSWQIHHDSKQRERAQYIRDMWQRSASAKLGMPYSRGKHVHLFINGIYWGIYCLSERIDENFCKTNYGGKKSDYDVIKPDENEGNIVVADYGNLEVYEKLFTVTEEENPNNLYNVLTGNSGLRLLDIDKFLDFIILNQYGGNQDWDEHNWYAIYNKANNNGIQFACWDSERIFEEVNANILNLYNEGKPTALFQKLMQNQKFKQQFVDRVYEHTKAGGLMTNEGTVELWDSLYYSISNALYCEAARWGDYRYNVHPHTTKGSRFDVDNFYKNERERLLNEYFTNRSVTYIQQLQEKGWYPNTQAPVFFMNGKTISGDVDINTVKHLTIQGSNVYYTIDGTDPVDWITDECIISSSAISYNEGESIHVPSNTQVIKARAKGNGEWSPLAVLNINGTTTGIAICPKNIYPDRAYGLDGRSLNHKAIFFNSTIFIKGGNKYLNK